MRYPMTEEEVKKKYQHAPLHEINKNKICLSVGQLKTNF